VVRPLQAAGADGRTALASEYVGKVTIGKLNVDDNPNTAFKFQVRGIPTLLLFKGGPGGRVGRRPRR